MIDAPTTLEIGIRLALATLLGGALGWERRTVGKPAGSRTMILTAVGAATFILAGLLIAADAGGTSVVVDPTRVLSYIVVGVGFLGGGTIVHAKHDVHGLTTAASIWITAAVGAACGLGQYALATLVAAIAFGSLQFLRPRKTQAPAEASGPASAPDAA